MIRPGWHLLLPSDAVGLAQPAVTEPTGSPPAANAGARPMEASPSPATSPPALATAPAPATTAAATPQGGRSGAAAPEVDRPAVPLGRGTIRVAQALALGLPVLAAGGLVADLDRRRRIQVGRHQQGTGDHDARRRSRTSGAPGPGGGLRRGGDLGGRRAAGPGRPPTGRRTRRPRDHLRPCRTVGHRGAARRAHSGGTAWLRRRRRRPRLASQGGRRARGPSSRGRGARPGLAGAGQRRARPRGRCSSTWRRSGPCQRRARPTGWPPSRQAWPWS